MSRALKLAFNHYNKSSSGNSGKSPLVILHGAFGNRQNWRTISRRITGTSDRDVYAVDLRNHGTSPHSDGNSLQDMTDDLFHFIETEVKAPSIIMGHSLGGRVCMKAALERDDLFPQLIVADMSPLTFPDTAKELGSYIDAMLAIDLTNMVNNKRIIEALNEVTKDEGVSTFLATNLVKDKETKTFNWKANLPSIKRSLSEFTETEGQFTGQYSKDTLFIYGTKAKYVLPEYKPLIQRFFPNTTYMPMDTGHWLHAEDPLGFTKHVVEFMDRGV